MAVYKKRNYSRKKPLRKLAKKAQYRKSANAQSRQISKLAKHLSTLKTTVSKELKLPVIYGCDFQCPIKSTNQFFYPVVIPLTSGVSQAGTGQLAVGQLPTSNLQGIHDGTSGQGPAIEWLPIFQSREMKSSLTAANRASVPAWCKLYKQTVKLRFLAGTQSMRNVITVSVVRANPKNISNVRGIVQRIDGQDCHGIEPSIDNAQDLIARGSDYAGGGGLTFSQPASGSPPTPPSVNSDGVTDIFWNKEMWHVEYQKSFTLGSSLNPLRASDESPSTASRPPYIPSQQQPRSNEYEQTCKFTVNYGGMKLSAVPSPDGSSTVLDPQEVTTMRYDNIPAEHKRFLVIHQSNPKAADNSFAPYLMYSSIISAQVPA